MLKSNEKGSPYRGSTRFAGLRWAQRKANFGDWVNG